MANYLYTLSGWTAPTPSTNLWRYDMAAQTWTQLASPPTLANIAGSNSALKRGGAYGSTGAPQWDVVLSDGKLYSYDVNANGWVGPLTNPGTWTAADAAQTNFQMAFASGALWLLDAASGFKKRPQGTGIITAPPQPAGTANGYGGTPDTAYPISLLFDGTDTLYATRGGTDAQWSKYAIAGNAWTALPVQATMATDWSAVGGQCAACIPIYASGKLTVLYWLFSGGWKGFRYDPIGNAWSAAGTHGDFGSEAGGMFGFQESATKVRIFPTPFLGGHSILYDLQADTFSADAAVTLPFGDFAEGMNFAATGPLAAAARRAAGVGFS